ncbi:MAG: P-loop NTPase, partial [Synechococcaceae cyanobacterium]|nr:P-loop NTPase [Synechococcaceae cyanobacterium]
MASPAPVPSASDSDIAALEACLSDLRDAGSGRNLLELGWIRRVRRRDERAIFELALPRFAASQQQRIVEEARAALLGQDGIADVQIELATAPAPPSSGPIGGAGHGTGGHGQLPERQPIPGVQRVIAVSSGKGGVGKSTVAVNLACALAARGLRVGLLDADIYGPNAPTMLGVADRTPEVRGSGNEQVLTPIDTCGIAMVSMGLLIQENQPVIWRG